MLCLALLACTGAPDPTPSTPPEPVEKGPPAEPRRGVTEVATPVEVLRAIDAQDRVAPVLVDVRFDADHTTFQALGEKLVGWGFTLVDGDGETWRVAPPPGSYWLERLEPLPEVRRAEEVLERGRLESGSFREGRETYGDVVHAWSQREGGPVETTGGVEVPPPILPDALLAGARACLAPAREEMEMGVSSGPGWERAMLRSPPTWVLVVDDYGYCHATGWIPLRPDASVATLTVAGAPASTVEDEALYPLAIDALSHPRAGTDRDALAALALLRESPQVAEAARRALPPFQRELFIAWAAREPDAARAFARTSMPTEDVALDHQAREKALLDPSSPVEVQLAALAAWRPGTSGPPAFLDRLRESPDPRVRARAWERTIEARAASCASRPPDPATWKECPDQRDAVAEALGPEATAPLLAAALEAPETVVTGIAAVRLAGSLGRHDLLMALVPRRTVDRDVRRVALDILVKARAPGSAELTEIHGAWLAWQAPASSAVSGP